MEDLNCPSIWKNVERVGNHEGETSVRSGLDDNGNASLVVRVPVRICGRVTAGQGATTEGNTFQDERAGAYDVYKMDARHKTPVSTGSCNSCLTCFFLFEQKER
jgi:hypothetical protein